MYSKEELVMSYLEAEAKRAKSKSIWFLLGGLVFGIVGAIVLTKFGINENWAIVPGSFAGVIGIMWALAEKSECEEAFNRMRDCANLSPVEFHQMRDILN
jgi:hypothetical protein